MALENEVNVLSIYYRPPTKLREGNVFTNVCHSVHGWGSVGLCMMSLPRLAAWSHCPAGGLCPGRILCLGGFC